MTRSGEMTLDRKFTDEQIEKICREGDINNCFCLSKLSKEIKDIRQLFLDQKQCLINGNTSLTSKSHLMINETIQIVHTVMERCLSDILIQEEWNLNTLTVPDSFKKKS
jgi:hypothetical protein